MGRWFRIALYRGRDGPLYSEAGYVTNFLGYWIVEGEGGPKDVFSWESDDDLDILAAAKRECGEGVFAVPAPQWED